MATVRHKNKKQFNRALAVTTAIVILFVASISATIAFLITGTESITNVFTPTKVETSVTIWDFDNENYDGARCRIYNDSDISAYIRAAVTVNWKHTETGHVYAVAPKEGTDYQLTIETDRWIEKTYENGETIYYHRSPVAPVAPDGSSRYATSPLFNNFKQLDTATQPDGYELVVEVLGSGIQSTPASVVEKNWKVTLNESGNIIAVN